MILALIRNLIRRAERGLRPNRITYAAMAIALALGGFGLPQLLKTDAQMRDGFGQLYGHDFAFFWSAGRAAIQTEPGAPWQREPFVAALDRHYPGRTTPADRIRFNYPPVMLLYLAPLAHLPVMLAFPLMMGMGFAFLLVGLWRINPSPRTFFWTMGAPLLWQSLVYGQWSFWFAGFLAFALMPVAHGRGPNPWACAAFIVKPTLAFGLPLACLGAPDGLRRATQTVLVAAALVLASIIFFGLEPWHFFFDALADNQRFLMGGLDELLPHSATFGSMLQFYGASADLARGAQAGFTLAVLLATAIIFRSDARGGLKAASLAAGCVLGAPYFMIYDLALLIPAAAFYIRDAQQHGFRDGDKLFLLIFATLPFAAREIQEVSGMPFCFLLALAFFIFIALRARQSSAENQRGSECDEAESGGMVPAERLLQHEH